MTSSRDRVPALDGLRGVAMLAVVSCHLVFPSAALQFDWLDRVLVNGWVGVDLFFVLSGFLITGILIEARQRPRYFRDFYARRALRIFPIYYLFLVGLFIWIPFGGWVIGRAAPWQYGQVAAHQSWYWTYTVNILQARSAFTDWFSTGHLWSLSVEEQYYLVWPAIILFVPSRRLPTACVAAFVTAIALRWWWVATHDHLLGAYVLTPLRMDSLAAGAFVATLARTTRGTAVLRRWYRPIGLLALAIALPVQGWLGADLQNRWVVLVGYSANAVAFAAGIVWLLDDSRVRRPFETNGLRRIGRISYGGYLYHLPLIGLCAGLRSRLVVFGAHGLPELMLAHMAWITGMVSLTIVVASLSYRWIETPFLALKDRFSGGGPAALAESASGLALGAPIARDGVVSG